MSLPAFWRYRYSVLALALALVLGAAVLAVALGIAGPAAVRSSAEAAVTSETRVIALQGAAAINATLSAWTRRLADPQARAASGLDVADSPAELATALAMFPRAGLPAGGAGVLFVHDETGKVLAADDTMPAGMRRALLEHHHAPATGAFDEGPGICPVCLDEMHVVSVESPLGRGRYLALNVDAGVVAAVGLMPFAAGGHRRAWLAAADGTLIHGVGVDPDTARGDDWLHTAVGLEDRPGAWRVHLAAHGASVLAGVTGSAGQLLQGALVSAMMLSGAAVLLGLEQRRRHGESLALAAKLAHQDKLVTLGTLTAGVGHELRNLITGIHANLEFAREAAHGQADSTEMTEALDDALATTRRLHEVANDLSAFGRRDAITPVPRPIRSAVEEALRLSRPLMRGGAPVDFEVHGDPVVPQIGGQITQVVVNLVRNAVAATGATRGSIRIRVSEAVDAGDTAVIDVEDSGPGIPPDVLPRLFDPFFTTRAHGEGTGLGLAVCAQIVQRHGGVITAANRPGGTGARFTVTLPTKGRLP